MKYTKKEIEKAKNKSLVKWDTIRHSKTVKEQNDSYMNYKCGFCILFVGSEICDDDMCQKCILDKGLVHHFCCREYNKWNDYSERIDKLKWAAFWANKLYERIKAINIDEALKYANKNH